MVTHYMYGTMMSPSIHFLTLHLSFNFINSLYLVLLLRYFEVQGLPILGNSFEMPGFHLGWDGAHWGAMAMEFWGAYVALLCRSTLAQKKWGLENENCSRISNHIIIAPAKLIPSGRK